ncbi:peptidase M13 [Paeniglutamicibacter antarcticus]|uniref:Peptidase M13 n=1 Tax=Arthrobacter terrae TaxID=2935737 RepID=A0A931CPW9_9MICC|nr:M13-type metalloendopeptidase [Arthrobacter terrae]MBG0740225.1 peptidase M13 [Arthrobacter terrae]
MTTPFQQHAETRAVGTQQGSPTVAQAAARPGARAAAQASGSRASSSGISSVNGDPSVRPQDDLYRRVNGHWLDHETIPADRALTGSFVTLRDEAESAVRSIIEQAAGRAEGGDGASPARTGSPVTTGSPVEAKFGDLYTSFMDEAGIEAARATPLRERLATISASEDIESFVRTMGRLDRTGNDGLFGGYVNNDAGDPQRCLLHLYQGGLGLPDESYYRQDQFAPIRAAYLAYVSTMFTLAGVPDPDAAAVRVVALETDIAAVHWDTVTMRDPQKTYNLKTREDALALFPLLAQWFEGMALAEAKTVELVVATPEFFIGAAQLLLQKPLRDWQEWLSLRIISGAASYLSNDFVEADFAFYGTTLSGTEEIKERWKRGVALVQGSLGEAVGQIYVGLHFPQSHKVRMELLVANLIEAYRQSISALTWMSAETIARALQKLDAFTPKIGYPDKWRDFSSLVIDAGDLIGNLERSHEFELERQLAKIGAPIDRGEWLMTPQTVNAYYNPTMNEVVFPAAILQPPFFDANADDAANYGGIGAVIGHEIGHGFDDKGSQFDGTGALRNWWTEADRAAFDQLTAKLVEQYSVLSPEAAPGHFVNGELTLGENIGDLGGLTIGYQAYLLSLNGQEPPVIDGMTGAQRFFFSWAECWRSKIRPEEALRRLTVDPHSPAELRCNAVVRNLNAFHDAFGVTTSDGLWLDPADRVRIW